MRGSCEVTIGHSPGPRLCFATRSFRCFETNGELAVEVHVEITSRTSKRPGPVSQRMPPDSQVSTRVHFLSLVFVQDAEIRFNKDHKGTATRTIKK